MVFGLKESKIETLLVMLIFNYECNEEPDKSAFFLPFSSFIYK